MNTFIALLRGINVSGQKLIRMGDLRSHLEEIGLKGIRSYLQSGNVIFRTEGSDPTRLSQEIRQKVLEKYSFEVPVIILDPGYLKHVIDQNPFIKDPETLQERLYVTFLFEMPREDRLSMLEDQKLPNEKIVIVGKTIYLYYPDGYGRAVMNNNLFEKVLKLEATTRNWKTVNKIYELAIN